jgi:hypothetical protein
MVEDAMADENLPSEAVPILLKEAPPEETPPENCDRPLELRALLAQIAYLQHVNHQTTLLLVFLVPYAICTTAFIVYLLVYLLMIWPGR